MSRDLNQFETLRKDELLPFNKLPIFMQEVMLIVGIQGIGKHALAKAIVESSTSKTLQCRTATHLPLPEEHSAERPRIDMVVFMIDSRSSASYIQVEQSLQYINRQYFLGKICFIATKVPTETQNLEVESITQLCDDHGSCLFWMDPTSGADRTVVAKKLLEMLNISAGLKPGITPLLTDCTHRLLNMQSF
ncbi:hypothetical protein LSH36_142g05019 [Paralvinella palmiformis]|uniref:Centromere protein M n=1 Tax=Paralvinella palmiformis TaxID=53620 RepID=A0AAD9JVA1_9ANNE|nr:hypothetical protein LSH36_142g05019 [Paralvinella palmiformis]